MSTPFFRGFRRENSDFFPMSSRHSAVFERNNVSPLRSSGIFSSRRGSDVQLRKKSGEPILTDFIKRTDSPKNEENVRKSLFLEGDDRRLRREKTESAIVLRYTEARKSLQDNLDARRREMEVQLDNARRRSRVLDGVATRSFDGEDYLFLQVIGFFRGCALDCRLY